MFMFLFASLAGVPRGPYFAQNASDHLEGTYWPAWRALFLQEERDAQYPMPRASKTRHLLSVLHGVPGLAVNAQPGATVTEGQGYAMFAAGMRRDVDALKGLAVAWQANGQGLEGTHPCGCCGLNYAAPHFKPADVCDGNVPSTCLCNLIDGAYMPGWEMPFAGIGSMGSAPDGDEDAVTGLIYLAELLDSEEARAYAVKSIVAFVLSDLGAANATANSRPRLAAPLVCLTSPLSSRPARCGPSHLRIDGTPIR